MSADGVGPGMSAHTLAAAAGSGQPPPNDPLNGSMSTPYNPHLSSAVLQPQAMHTSAAHSDAPDEPAKGVKGGSLHLLQSSMPPAMLAASSAAPGGTRTQHVDASAAAAAGVFTPHISPQLLTAGGAQPTQAPAASQHAMPPNQHMHFAAAPQQQQQLAAPMAPAVAHMPQPPVAALSPTAAAAAAAAAAARQRSTKAPSVTPSGAPLPVKGKMEGWERVKVNEFVDAVKARHIIVSRGELARELRSFVNMARPQLFYEKLISRKRLNQELGPLLAPRRHRRGNVEVEVLESLKRNPELFRAALEHHQQSQAAMLASHQAAADGSATHGMHSAAPVSAPASAPMTVGAMPMGAGSGPMHPMQGGQGGGGGVYMTPSHGFQGHVQMYTPHGGMQGGVFMPQGQWGGGAVATSNGMMFMPSGNGGGFAMQPQQGGFYQPQQGGFLNPPPQSLGNSGFQQGMQQGGWAPASGGGSFTSAPQGNPTMYMNSGAGATAGVPTATSS